MKRAISTKGAPAALGPYSQAISAGNFLYCSGQIPLDPATGEMIQGDFSAQVVQVLENLGAVLRAHEMEFAHVVKTTVFLTDLSLFGQLNEIYGKYFPAPYPARSTVQVSALPKGAQVEIELIAAF